MGAELFLQIFSKIKKALDNLKKRRLRLEISFKEATPMINYPNILKKAFGYHILNAERGAQIHARSQAEFYTEPKITL